MEKNVSGKTIAMQQMVKAIKAGGPVNFIPPLDVAEKAFLAMGVEGGGLTVQAKETFERLKADGKSVIRDTSPEFEKVIIACDDPDFLKTNLKPGDIVFNPFDARWPANWDFWGELRRDYDYRSFVKALIPIEDGDPGAWAKKGARNILHGLLMKTRSIKSLVLAIRSDPYTLIDILDGTPGANILNPKNEKACAAYMDVLRDLASDLFEAVGDRDETQERFSFRDWVANNEDRRWIFLTNRADQRDILNPLVAVVLDIVASEILSQVPNNKLPEGQRRCITIVQEKAGCLPSIPKWPELAAQGRKFGAVLITMT